MPPLVIDVVSDAVCPWCFVGKRRLDSALAAGDKPAPQVRWRPFQLDATIPAEGLDRKTYMRAKFGDTIRLKEVHDRLNALGAEVGISFDFEAIQRSPNTLDAHRLIRWAAEAGVQDAVVEGLFSAYFEQGRDIGDSAVLAEIAGAAGMDANAIKQRLASPVDLEDVQAEIGQAQQIGISGVPFFIFANKLAVSGAQSVEVLRQAMAEAAKETPPSALA
jgi:predicted DsbA family dithiol-disulfide isomerase